MADLKQSGTMPFVRVVFMTLVITGTRTPMYFLVRGVGIGSRLQLLRQFSKSALACPLLSQVQGHRTLNQ